MGRVYLSRPVLDGFKPQGKGNLAELMPAEDQICWHSNSLNTCSEWIQTRINYPGKQSGKGVTPAKKLKESGQDHVLQMSECGAEFYKYNKSEWMIAVSLSIATLLHFMTQQAQVKWDSDTFSLLERHVRKDPWLVEWLPGSE